MSRRLCFLLVFLLISGCHSPEYMSRKPGDQLLVLNMFSEPPTLDPGKASDATSVMILHMLFEGLTRIEDSGTPEPAIAESIDISEDGRTYTFHLRDSMWSDGAHVTAHDFEFAWKRVLSPTFPSDFAYQLYVIKNGQAAKEGKIPLEEVGVRAEDAQTLIVELEQPTPYFLETLVLPCYLPVPQHIVVSDPSWAFEAGPQYVSNGPFTLDRWTHHSEIKVLRNPLYWDAKEVRLNAIVLLMVEDVNTELNLFEDGAIDWAGKPVSMGLPTDALTALKRSGRLEESSMAATYFYLINTTKPPFNNSKLRRALAYAIDRQVIIDNIVQGGEEVATGLVPPSISGRKEVYVEDHNVKEAKRLFKEALSELGMRRNELPSISLIYNTSEGHHKIAQAVQQQWYDVLGVRVELQNLEWKVYLDKVQHKNYDIARMSWIASFNDPITFLDMFKHEDDSINMTGWYHPSYTRLLEQSIRNSDPVARLQQLADAEKLLMQEMPVIPIYHLTNSYMHNPKLKGVYLSPIGYIDFKRAYFEEDSE